MDTERPDLEEPVIIRWWRPDWTGVMASVGYRWLAGVGALVILTLITVAVLFSPIEWALRFLLIKLAVLLGGATISLALADVPLTRSAIG